MNKAELVSAIAQKCEQSQADANRLVDGFCEAVMEALANGEQVALVGFGTFKVGDRAARKGRNPRTGEPIDIAASKVPSARPKTPHFPIVGILLFISMGFCKKISVDGGVFR